MKRLHPDQPAYLSFVIVARNAASTLERCLASLRARAPDAEIVVVDNLSDDAGVDVWLDKAKVLASLTEAERLDPHSAIKLKLEAAGATVRFVRLNNETCAYATNPNWQKTPAVWVRVHVPGDETLLKSVRCANRVTAVFPESWILDRCGKTTQQIAQCYADVYAEYAGEDGTHTKESYASADMAAARNFAHGLATGVWQCWVDADDELPGADETDRLLRLNGQHPDTWESGAKLVTSGTLAKPIGLEDFLRLVESQHPEHDCLRCSYLYHSDADGLAKTWQKRERFVRQPAGKYRWVQPAHEFWARVDGRAEASAENHGILFVHRKEWTREDLTFSTQRHFNILVAAYEKGERLPRNLKYLADMATQLCPEREEQFAFENLAASVYEFDRYQALQQVGRLCARRGLFLDAKTYFAGALAMCPTLPDAYAIAGDVAETAGDDAAAVQHYQTLVTLPVGQPHSIMAPRDQRLTFRMKLALVLEKQAKAAIGRGQHAQALQLLTDALACAEYVNGSPMLGGDDIEALAFLNRRRNARDAQHAAIELYKLWDLLVRNDESLKAMELLKSIPFMLQDHPLVLAIEQWSQRVYKHVTDPVAYRDFYETDGGGKDGALVMTQKEFLEPSTSLPRTQMLLHWLEGEQARRDAVQDARPIRIIEFGTFDGVNVLPVLKKLDRVEYVAVDAQTRILAILRDAANKSVTRPERLLTIAGTHDDTQLVRASLTAAGHPFPQEFDAVVFFEVIEHVPDPVDTLRALRTWLKKDGTSRLFLSTPWGAYDNGAPVPPPPTRDPRGHVRAMTLRDVRDDCAEAGLRLEEAYNAAYPFHVGDTMHVVAARHASAVKEPIVFVVPSALWDWNSRHVEATGIGASEKMIVQIARELKRRQPNRLVQVYGPVNEPEVHRGVEYWPREQLRKVPKDAAVIVSRNPGAAPYLKAQGVTPRFLWLQDAYYPDLNEQTACDYEKIVVLTDWHETVMLEAIRNNAVTKPLRDEHSALALDRFVQINNFVVPEHFAAARHVAREPHRFVYASSPDRALIPLLELWPLVLEKFPDATLDIFYGWEGCIKLAAHSPGWAHRYQAMRQKYDKLRWQKGVTERGRVNHWQLAFEYSRSAALLYPTLDFDETGFCSGMEAMAGGCVNVCTTRAALPETCDDPETRFVDLPHASDDKYSFNVRFMEAVVQAVAVPEEQRRAMSDRVLAKHSIGDATDAWLKLIDG